VTIKNIGILLFACGPDLGFCSGEDSASGLVKTGALKLNYQEIFVIYSDEQIRGKVGEFFDGYSCPVNYCKIDEAEPALASASASSLLLFAISRITDSSKRRVLELIRKSAAFDAQFCIACDEMPADVELELFGKGAKGIIANAKDFDQLPALVEALHRGEMWCSRSVLQNLLKHLGKPQP